jgi:hypothetical protein
MSHVRELHQVLCSAVVLEGFRSDLGTSGIALLVLALVVSAPAVSSLWSGLRQSH